MDSVETPGGPISFNPNEKDDNEASFDVSESIRRSLEDFEFSELDHYIALDRVLFLIGNSRTGKSTIYQILKQVAVQSCKLTQYPRPVIE